MRPQRAMLVMLTVVLTVTMMAQSVQADVSIDTGTDFHLGNVDVIWGADPYSPTSIGVSGDTISFTDNGAVHSLTVSSSVPMVISLVTWRPEGANTSICWFDSVSGSGVLNFEMTNLGNANISASKDGILDQNMATVGGNANMALTIAPDQVWAIRSVWTGASAPVSDTGTDTGGSGIHLNGGGSTVAPVAKAASFSPMLLVIVIIIGTAAIGAVLMAKKHRR